jgi:AcrR family transcriptional regulator
MNHSDRPIIVKARISKKHWIDAAIKVLVNKSIEHVRVEPLADSLGVTKGSFYWHFKDRNALLEAILATWVEHSCRAVTEQLEADRAEPEARLQQLLEGSQPWGGEPSSTEVELAIRAWARRSALARQAVDQVDETRLASLSMTLQALGVDATDASIRSYMIYACVQSLSHIKAQSAAGTADFSRSCLNILLHKGAVEKPRHE